MIKESDKIVAKYIESGAYFSDAFDWYTSKYLFPVTFRSYLTIFLVVLSLGLSSLFYQSLIKINNDKYPFPIYAFDETQYFPFIRSLSKDKEPLELSFSRYFIKAYVSYRENYVYTNFIGENKERLLNKIKAFSSRKIYRDYLDSIDAEQNPDSPIVVYKNRIIRNIDITNIEFIRYNLAKVSFKATELGAGISKESTWVAEVAFQLDDIEDAFRRKDKVNFTVTSYKTYNTY